MSDMFAVWAMVPTQQVLHCVSVEWLLPKRTQKTFNFDNETNANPTVKKVPASKKSSIAHILTTTKPPKHHQW